MDARGTSRTQSAESTAVGRGSEQKNRRADTGGAARLKIAGHELGAPFHDQNTRGRSEKQSGDPALSRRVPPLPDYPPGLSGTMGSTSPDAAAETAAARRHPSGQARAATAQSTAALALAPAQDPPAQASTVTGNVRVRPETPRRRGHGHRDLHEAAMTPLPVATTVTDSLAVNGGGAAHVAHRDHDRLGIQCAVTHHGQSDLDIAVASRNGSVSRRGDHRRAARLDLHGLGAQRDHQLPCRPPSQGTLSEATFATVCDGMSEDPRHSRRPADGDLGVAGHLRALIVTASPVADALTECPPQRRRSWPCSRPSHRTGHSS